MDNNKEFVTYHGGDPKVRFRDFKGNEPPWAKDIRPDPEPVAEYMKQTRGALGDHHDNEFKISCDNSNNTTASSLRAVVAQIIDSNKYEAWTVDRANQMADSILAAIASQSGHVDLLKLAEAATPGPWNSSGSSVDDFDVHCTMRMEWMPNGTGNEDEDDGTNLNHEADSYFIAGTNPAVVIALLAEIAVLRENESISLLRELFALVKGECPRLLDEDSGGNSKLELQIETLLSKV